jgi:hypothetical protein
MFRPRDCSGAILDTFSVRRARDGFRRVVGDGLAPNYFCRTREGWRVPKWWGAPPEARWGARRLALALTAGAHGSYGVRRTLAGAELSVALRYRWGFWLDDPAEFWSPSSFWRSQIGQCFELSLRGRMLGAIERGTSSGEWLLGVHPSFRSDLVFSRTATATLLGALVPEAGIARMQARTRPYIAWRFPFELRRLAPTERQYPIAFTDRVGFEVAPTLLLPLGVRPLPWSAGLSLGVTIW